MDSRQYKIIFHGNIREGFQPDDVRKNIARAFKLNDQKIKKLFSGGPVLIKKGIDEASALKYKKAFYQAGAVCDIETMPDTLSSSSGKSYQTHPKTSRTPENQPLNGAKEPDLIWMPDTLQPENKDPSERESTLWRGMVGVQKPGEDIETCKSDQGRPVEKEIYPEKERKIQDNKKTASVRAELERAKEILHKSIIPSEGIPEIKFESFSTFSFILQNFLAMVLSYFIVGLFWGPKLIFGFLASHVDIHGQKLKFDSIWTFVLTLLVSGITYIFWALLFFLFLTLFRGSILLFLVYLIMLALLPIPMGFGMAVMIQSLQNNTTLDNFKVCRPICELNLDSGLKFARNNFKQIYLWGLASAAGGFLLTPITWAVILKEWFAQLEINGYKYQIKIPWGKVMLYCLVNIICFGFYIFRFVRFFFETVLDEGEWVKMKTGVV